MMDCYGYTMKWLWLNETQHGYLYDSQTNQYTNAGNAVIQYAGKGAYQSAGKNAEENAGRFRKKVRAT